MLTPELFLFVGLIMIATSTIGFLVAQAIRSWFFMPDPRQQLSFAELQSDQNRLDQPQAVRAA